MEGEAALGLGNRVAGEARGFDPDGDGVFRLENGVEARPSRGSAARQFGDFNGVTVKLVLPIDDHFVMEIRGSHSFFKMPERWVRQKGMLGVGA